MMKYVVAILMLFTLVVGCTLSANTAANQLQTTIVAYNNSSQIPPATTQSSDNKTAQTVDVVANPDTTENALKSTVLIFSTNQWETWEAEDGFWYEIEMLKPILTSRSSMPLHWLQHQNTRPWKQGSGVLIDKNGYILTSRSILEDCDDPCGRSLNSVGSGAQFIYVFLYENGELNIERGHGYIATLICKHPQDDLAIIKITPRNVALSYSDLGNSDIIKRGQNVMAIGYPANVLYAESFSAYKWKTDTIGFNCEPSVTDGTVSAIRKFDTYPVNYTMAELNADYSVKVIQTNAEINYGNWGGPLIDESGKVIGIFVGKVYGASGLGFAVAVNEAKDLIITALARSIDGVKDGMFLSCELGDPCYSQTAWESSPARRCKYLCEKFYKPQDAYQKCILRCDNNTH